jgi:hypothetical protein
MNINELKSLFRYNPDTGEIFWIAKGKGKIKKKAAGSKLHSGYTGICIGKKRVLAHRIAWALHHDKWPEQFIDHINGEKSDNRIVNLRECTLLQNGKNCKKKSNNTSGHTGVYFDKSTNNWKASIKVNWKNISLGRFANIEDAIKIRKEAEEKYFGEWARK